MIYSCESYSVDLSKILFVSCIFEGSHKYYSIYLDGLSDPVEPYRSVMGEEVKKERDALVAAWKEYNTTIIIARKPNDHSHVYPTTM